VEFVKEAVGLRSADPKLVPEAHLIREASHGFLSALARAGARVIHAEAARLAERRQLPLEFHPLDGETAFSRVSASTARGELRAVATAASEGASVRITALSSEPLADPAGEVERLCGALGQAGIPAIQADQGPCAVRLTVPAFLAAAASRAVHQAFVLQSTGVGQVRRAS